MEQSVVSVIIVSWNVEDVIEECLNSLMQFSSQPLQIIVVDNNSSDRTCEVVRQYGTVELIESKENLGFSRANNVGLKKARGDYIFFLNPDTVFVEDILTKSIEILESSEQTGVVSPRLLNRDLSLQASCSNFYSPVRSFFDEAGFGAFMPAVIQKKYFQRSYAKDERLETDWTIGAAQLIRSEDCRRIGGYSEDYFMYVEDADFCMKVHRELHKKVIYAADLRLIHLGGVSESKNVNHTRCTNFIESMMHFAQKFYGRRGQKRLRRSLIMAYTIKKGMFRLLYNIKKQQLYQQKEATYREYIRVLKAFPAKPS